MDVEERPKHLPRIQVRLRHPGPEMHVLFELTRFRQGAGRCWTMQTHESLGQPFRAPSHSCRSDSIDKE